MKTPEELAEEHAHKVWGRNTLFDRDLFATIEDFLAGYAAAKAEGGGYIEHGFKEGLTSFEEKLKAHLEAESLKPKLTAVSPGFYKSMVRTLQETNIEELLSLVEEQSGDSVYTDEVETPKEASLLNRLKHLHKKILEAFK